MILVYALVFGTIVPFMDDMDFVEVLSGERPAGWGWLIAAHNEHVFPLARAMMLAAARAFDLDLRQFYLLNTAAISGAALILTGAAFRSRGRGSWLDALIPLYGASLLHFWNLTHATNLPFGLYLLLFSAILAAVLLDFSRSRRGIVLTGGMVAALAMTGAYGLAAALVFVPFLLLLGLTALREEGMGARQRGALLILAAGGGGAIGVSYLWFVLTRTQHAEAGSLADVIECSMKAAAMAWCRQRNIFDPEGARPGRMILPGLIVFGLGTGLWGLRSAGAVRRRSLGLIAGLLAVLAVCAAVGYGRAGSLSHLSLPFWYVTLATPLPLVLWLLADRCGGRLGRIGVGGALGVLGVMGVVNTTPYALERGWQRLAASQRFTRDARAGLSPAELNARYKMDFYRWSGDRTMTPALEAMRRREQGPFGRVGVTWFDPPGFLMFERHVDLVDDEDGRVRVVAAEGGAVEAAGSGVVLSAKGREAIFLLPVEGGPGTSGRMIQVELLSPHTTRARLGTEGGAMHQAEVRPGANLLTFVLEPGTIKEVVRFSPGEEAGNYRLRSVRVFDLP